MKKQETLRLIRKLIGNAKIAAAKTLNSGECLMVLGDEVDLGEVAYIWERNGHNIELITTHLILDFIKKTNHSSEEIAIYKQALKDFGSFLIKAYTENNIGK